jgi:hypothetical protein
MGYACAPGLLQEISCAVRRSTAVPLSRGWTARGGSASRGLDQLAGTANETVPQHWLRPVDDSGVGDVCRTCRSGPAAGWSQRSKAGADCPHHPASAGATAWCSSCWNSSFVGAHRKGDHPIWVVECGRTTQRTNAARQPVLPLSTPSLVRPPDPDPPARGGSRRHRVWALCLLLLLGAAGRCIRVRSHGGRPMA